MSWNNVGDIHKKRYDKDFVSCEEFSEREFIVQTILDEFPLYTKNQVENAIEHFCEMLNSSMHRTIFLKFMENLFS